MLLCTSTSVVFAVVRTLFLEKYFIARVKMGKFYAIRRGKETGIFKTWTECKERVHGVGGCLYKGFATRKEAEAWLNKPDYSVSADPVTQTIVYTDGSFHQGKAGAGIFFGVNDSRNVACDVPGPQTNNRGEVWAIIRALELAPDGPIEIRTDSEWAVNCANKLWSAQENLDLFAVLWRLLNERRRVVLKWVPSHCGEVGNEGADELAKRAVGLQKYKASKKE